MNNLYGYSNDQLMTYHNGDKKTKTDDEVYIEKLISNVNERKYDEVQKIKFNDDHTLLLKAMIDPHLYKGVCFPSGVGLTPTAQIPKNTTVLLRSNANGVVWAEFNFGQYLGNTVFQNSGTGINGAAGAQFGVSNLFVSNPNSNLDGITDANDVIQIQALDTMQSELDLYNCVTPGPSAVWFDYTGPFNAASGNVVAGINYTTVTDASVPGTANGFLPDLRYTTLKAVEDCPHSLRGNLNKSFKAIFLPHDEKVLHYKGPKEGHAGIQQRLFILITGAPPNENIGTLRIASLFAGLPNPKYADLVNGSVVAVPNRDTLNLATEILIKNKEVIKFTNNNNFASRLGFDTN